MTQIGDVDTDWNKKCTWEKCNGCTECGIFDTDAPTKTPVSTSPTKAPVTDTPTKTPVSSSPTKMPVTDTDDFCCTWDFFHCGVDELCNTNMVNCQSGCGGVWMEKASPAMKCIEKFNSCTSNASECCLGLSCVGDGDTYSQCVDGEVV